MTRPQFSHRPLTPKEQRELEAKLLARKTHVPTREQEELAEKSGRSWRGNEEPLVK